MATLNPNDPLSRLISIETARPPHPVSLPDRAGTDVAAEAVASVDAAKDTDGSLTAEEHSEQKGDLFTFAGATALARHRRSEASKRSAARRLAVRDSQAPGTVATDDAERGSDAAETADAESELVAQDAGVPGAGVADEADHAAVLEELAPTIDRARAFAEHWDACYRPEIFRVALGALLGGLLVDPVGSAQMHGPAMGGRGAGGARDSQDGTQVGHAAAGVLDPTVKLARKLGVHAQEVERAVIIGDDNHITIIGHVEGKTKKELQTKFGLVYCFIKEIALGDPLVDIEELRALCVEHGCYDLANFTSNFRKDAKSGLLREIGAKGSRARKYRLAKKGLDEAARLLREMVEQ